MARILITGCSGFLASHLLDRLAAAAPADRLFGLTEVEGFSRPGLAVFRCDIRNEADLAAVIREVLPERVFHLAAVTNVGQSWKDPRLTYEVNFLGSANLLEALRRHTPAARVLVMSSAEIYRRGDGPLSEEAAVACGNPYALSKLGMEMQADMYADAFALQVIKLRSFNFTGPGQERRFVAADFAAQIAEAESGRGPALIQVGNLQAERDFSDVRDVARYLHLLAERGRPGETINLCSGRGITIRRLLDTLLSLSRKPIRVEVDPGKFRPLDTPVMVGDPTRLRQRYGLMPEIPLERTLADLLDDWRSRK